MVWLVSIWDPKPVWVICLLLLAIFSLASCSWMSFFHLEMRWSIRKTRRVVRAKNTVPTNLWVPLNAFLGSGHSSLQEKEKWRFLVTLSFVFRPFHIAPILALREQISSQDTSDYSRSHLYSSGYVPALSELIFQLSATISSSGSESRIIVYKQQDFLVEVDIRKRL